MLEKLRFKQTLFVLYVKCFIKRIIKTTFLSLRDWLRVLNLMSVIKIPDIKSPIIQRKWSRILIGWFYEREHGGKYLREKNNL